LRVVAEVPVVEYVCEGERASRAMAISMALGPVAWAWRVRGCIIIYFNARAWALGLDD
jgi:hypothetical protein